jgi:hypothetical protein
MVACPPIRWTCAGFWMSSVVDVYGIGDVEIWRGLLVIDIVLSLEEGQSHSHTQAQ